MKIYSKNIVAFICLICLSISIGFASDNKYATKEGLFKLKVVKSLKIEIDEHEINLGVIPQGMTKNYFPPEIMTFTIMGEDNEYVEINIDKNETDNGQGVTIDAKFNNICEKLDNQGKMKVECKVTKAVVSPNARLGTHVFHQKISVEYKDL